MNCCHSLHTGWLEDAEINYRNYKDLMERYHELSAFMPDKNKKEDGLIKKLMDIFFEKQIANEINAIIREYIEKYVASHSRSL